MNKNLQFYLYDNYFRKTTFILLFTLIYLPAFSQNELYLNGINQFYNNGCLLYVNGDINNNDGLFVNTVNGIYTGTIELTGNWTNTVSVNSYSSTGIERFSGNNNQLISGKWNDTSGNTNQLYNFKVNKNSGYISLAQNTHVNIAGTIDFESSGGVIRTAPYSTANTGDYMYYLYLQNPSVTAISNYSWPGGTSRYIEGKFKRRVDRVATYQFPIGFQPTNKDGMEPYEIKFNITPTSTGILGYIRPATINVITQNVLCDVGTDPGAGTQQFPMCTGPKDGIYDLYYLDQNLSHEWLVTPDNTTAYNYDITFFPGNNLDNLSYYTLPGACDGAYSGKRLRVYTKDGIVGGSQQYGIGSYAPFSHISSYIWCDFDNNTLQNQTSFSAFRIFGTSDASYTTLPVELIYFDITPINNSYFQLNWETASESNNAGFEVQRSNVSNNFSAIGFVRGNGTTALPHAYQFEDKNVEKNKDYYYRLKQTDNNGRYTYTNIIHGKLLNETKEFSVSDIYPNPSYNESFIDIYTPQAETISVSIINVLGQNLEPIAYDLVDGVNKIKLDATTLSAGTYLLTISCNEKLYTKKFIKK
ncbi:MAG: T9SS type A sorting domain-containing protein [Chitinophagales bacterium]